MHIVKPEKSKTVGDYILELQRHFLYNLVLLKKVLPLRQHNTLGGKRYHIHEITNSVSM